MTVSVPAASHATASVPGKTSGTHSSQSDVTAWSAAVHEAATPEAEAVIKAVLHTPQPPAHAKPEAASGTSPAQGGPAETTALDASAAAPAAAPVKKHTDPHATAPQNPLAALILAVQGPDASAPAQAGTASQAAASVPKTAEAAGTVGGVADKDAKTTHPEEIAAPDQAAPAANVPPASPPAPAALDASAAVSATGAAITAKPAGAQTKSPSATIAAPAPPAPPSQTKSQAAVIAAAITVPSPAPAAMAATAPVIAVSHTQAAPAPAVAATPAPIQTSTAATPAALAATITAMHQSGQSSLTLRLDPPGLGSLAIHLSSSQAGVNVLFVPSAAPTAQLLTQNLDGLRSAMANAGLTLGQAQVGGGGGQNQGQSPSYTPQPSALTPPPSTGTEDDSGVRAYA